MTPKMTVEKLRKMADHAEELMTEGWVEMRLGALAIEAMEAHLTREFSAAEQAKRDAYFQASGRWPAQSSAGSSST